MRGETISVQLMPTCVDTKTGKIDTNNVIFILIWGCLIASSIECLELGELKASITSRGHEIS